MKFVVFPAVDQRRLAVLSAAAPGADWVNAAAEDEAIAAMTGADAVLGKITPAMLARADRLQWVQSFTASLEHYLFPELRDHRCILTNMRGLFSDVIADQVMGYILCFARNLHIYIRQQREGRWAPVGGEDARVSLASGPGTVNAMDRATIFLPGRGLGIVGLGAIGREIAQRARAFGLDVRAVDRDAARIGWVEGVGLLHGPERLPGLLAWADFVVIAAPHTPETERLFDAAMLRNMKPSSYLINIGRGAIVVLDDLVAALQAGRLAGAALDVYEIEPLPAGHPLWSMPNVILTPHTAGYSPRIAGRHLTLLAENVGRFARGEPLQNVVNKAFWY